MILAALLATATLARGCTPAATPGSMCSNTLTWSAPLTAAQLAGAVIDCRGDVPPRRQSHLLWQGQQGVPAGAVLTSTQVQVYTANYGSSPVHYDNITCTAEAKQ